MPNNKIKRVRFFNTFEPVTTFYRDLLPALALREIGSEVYISSAEYRSGRERLDRCLQDSRIHIKVLPALGVRPVGRWQKIWLMMSYGFTASAVSLISPKVDLNIFLTQPPMFAFWGYVLKILRGQKYYCILMDIYPDVADKDGVLRKDSLSVRMLSLLITTP